MRVLALLLLVAALGSSEAAMLRRKQKQARCNAEKKYHEKMALAFKAAVVKGKIAGDDDGDEESSASKLEKILDKKKFEFETFPSRGSACSECDRWRNAHSDSTYVTDNKGLCSMCYSVESSCNDGEYQWSCFDQNRHFKDLQKQGSTDSAKRLGDVNSGDPAEIAGYETESGDPIFDDKEPQNCAEE